MLNSINIFGREIPLYGACFLFGIALAVVTAVFLAPKKDIPKYEIVYSSVFIFVGALVGAKLLFIIVSAETIIRENVPFVAVIQGGFVFYGGLIGGILGLFIYARQFNMSFIALCDIYAVVVPLGHAFGRVGCFFAGCCYGIPHDGAFSITYRHTDGNTPLGVPLLPVQLIEAACLIILFAVLLAIHFRCHSGGAVTTTYFIGYSVIRFSLEFLRGDVQRGFLLNLSTSQWISILIFITATAYIIKNKRQSD